MFFRGVWYVSEQNILAPASGQYPSMLFLSRNNFPRNRSIDSDTGAPLIRRKAAPAPEFCASLILLA